MLQTHNQLLDSPFWSLSRQYYTYRDDPSYIELFNTLVKQSNINESVGESGFTALHCAFAHMSESETEREDSIVRFLVDNGANLNRYALYSL